MSIDPIWTVWCDAPDCDVRDDADAYHTARHARAAARAAGWLFRPRPGGGPSLTFCWKHTAAEADRYTADLA